MNPEFEEVDDEREGISVRPFCCSSRERLRMFSGFSKG
jgi:hypothetical protein